MGGFWSELEHGLGDAGDIPALLDDARAAPPQMAIVPGPWNALWERLCRDRRIFVASYAAVPELIALAESRDDGVRWEAIETRSVGNSYDPIKNTSSVPSPIMNMLWKVPGSEKDQVRLGISRTYKAVNVGELVPRRFFAANNSPVTPDFIGNPNLKPELSWGIDAGYEHYPAGGGNISLSVYHRRIEDII